MREFDIEDLQEYFLNMDKTTLHTTAMSDYGVDPEEFRNTYELIDRLVEIEQEEN